MIVEYILAALILLGGFFCFVAGLGVLRLPDVLIRMHASTKAGTLGSGLILIAVAVFFADTTTITRAVATILFLLITAPVAAHMIGRAAFRSGVSVGRTKILAYGICGLFCAMGGLSLAALTGIGEPVPGPYLMASVAAVVLGGVVLGGGKGGLIGPIIAVFILRIIRTILTLLAIDPNVTTIIEGTIMVAVVMLGTAATMRGAKR